MGTPGSKPVTTLSYPSGPFLGLVNAGNHQYAMNEGGVWQLNHSPDDGHPKDDGQDIVYSVRLNDSDFGISGNLKKIMYLYTVMSSGAGAGECPTFSFQADEQEEFYCNAGMVSQKKVRTPVKCRCQGTYWTIGLDSNVPFTLLNMSVNYIVRPSGISNG